MARQPKDQMIQHIPPQLQTTLRNKWDIKLFTDACIITTKPKGKTLITFLAFSWNKHPPRALWILWSQTQQMQENLYFPYDKNISQLKGVGTDIFLKVTEKASVLCCQRISRTQCDFLALACYGVAGKLSTELNMLHLGQNMLIYTCLQTQFHL